MRNVFIFIHLTKLGQNAEVVCEKLSTTQDLVACKTTFSNNKKQLMSYYFISLSHHCGGILVHTSLQHRFSSLNFAVIHLHTAF